MARFIPNRGGFLNVDMMTSIDLEVHEEFGSLDPMTGGKEVKRLFRAEGWVATINNHREIIYTEWRATLSEVNLEVLDRWGHTVLFVQSDIKEAGGNRLSR